MEVSFLAIVAAAAASVGALLRTTRVRSVHAIGVPLQLLGWAALLATVLPEGIRDRPLLVAIGALFAFAAAWLGATLLAGREHWLLVVGAATLTIRVPVPTGDGTAMLLAPLYVVIGLGAFVLMRREFSELARDRSPLPDQGGATRLLDVGAAVLPAIATISLTWSFVPEATAEVLAFFLVPFVLAYAVVRAWASARVDLRPAGIALVASGVVVALVGLVQAATQDVWWNPKVIDANRFRPDFRTNSLYWDPNMYGRALVVAIVAAVAYLLVTRASRRTTPLLAGIVAVLVAALWNTYSQSSWVALAAGLVVLGVLTLPPRPRRWAAAIVLLVVLVGTPLAARTLAEERGSTTGGSGRQEIVRTGLALASERPLLGWGVGSFEQAAEARERERGNTDPGLLASHTTPVTVFAELGIVGAFAYLTLLTSAVVTMLARWRRASTPAAAARARGDVDAAGTGWPIGPVIWASATFIALVAHSMLYAGFFEDPTLWVALALLASLPAVEPDADASEAGAEAGVTTRAEGATVHTG
jgi:O-antigen ligase